MAITFEAYAKNNLCYKAARTMPTGSPAGIIIHSTGADNPNLKRYVNAPEICGVNPYKNYFDRPDSNVCPHAVIGKDKNGDVRAAKLLPWNVCCWGCGNGSKGSYNYAPAYIQIEIAEDALNDRAYFEEAFGLAVQLCQLLNNFTEGCMVYIHLRYKEHTGQFVFFTELPCFLSTNFHTGFTRYHDDRCICCCHCFFCFSYKIEIAWCIQQVDLRIFPDQRYNRCVD